MKNAIIFILAIVCLALSYNIATMHKINPVEDAYIINAIDEKQSDGYCLAQWEIDFVKADKWLTDEEKNAIFENDMRDCTPFITQYQNYAK